MTRDMREIERPIKKKDLVVGRRYRNRMYHTGLYLGEVMVNNRSRTLWFRYANYHYQRVPNSQQLMNIVDAGTAWKMCDVWGRPPGRTVGYSLSRFGVLTSSSYIRESRVLNTPEYQDQKIPKDIVKSIRDAARRAFRRNMHKWVSHKRENRRYDCSGSIKNSLIHRYKPLCMMRLREEPEIDMIEMEDDYYDDYYLMSEISC